MPRFQEASHGDLVTCRNGAACSLSRRKERLPSQRSITGEPPSVFSLGLVWNNWGPGLVADLLGMLSPVVDLDVVFSRGQEHGVAGAGEVSAGKVSECRRSLARKAFGGIPVWAGYCRHGAIFVLLHPPWWCSPLHVRPDKSRSGKHTPTTVAPPPFSPARASRRFFSQAQLRGFFCFQVQKHHYVAFVYNRGRQEWLLLDDDQAVPVRGKRRKTPDMSCFWGRWLLIRAVSTGKKEGASTERDL